MRLLASVVPAAIRRAAIVAAFSAIALTGARAQDSLTRAVDQLLSRFSPSGPGCVVAVYQDGRVRFAKGYGSANIEYAVPITPETPFITGSLSKQFTAAAIALLVEDKRIALSDDVRKYVPELPNYGKSITIDHLVHHTSGFRDWWELVGLAGLRFDDTYAVQDVLDMTSRQRALNFDPGSRYLYSNTGYIVLGVIVQRVTGKSLRAFAEERIFRPLGMNHTHFQDDHTQPVPGRASAYSPLAGGGYAINIWNNDLVGQGGVMTTALDLAKWDENFYSGRVGGSGFLARQLERGKLNDGTVLTYAFGVEVGTYRGLPTVEHTGSTGGYRSAFVRFPAQRTSVATLCNRTDAGAAPLAQRVADIVLRDKFTQPVATASAAGGGRGGGAGATASAAGTVVAGVARFAGKYHSDELQATYELVAAEGRLIVKRPRGAVDTLTARDATTFGGGGITLRFGAESTTGFALDGGRVRNIIFARK
jgi:CubicO group peptidase (beta-lactamase class C family)